MSIATFEKDPAAVLDYKLDWAAWLSNDTITASSWTVLPGITRISDTFNPTSAIIRLSGGTDGQDYELINHVTLASGQQDERAITVQVRQRELESDVDEKDRVSALALVIEYAEIDAAPTLTETQVSNILERNRRASTWKPSTAYKVGDYIFPPIRNGHKYLCISPGISTSQDLGEAQFFAYWRISPGDEFYDSAGTLPPLMWQEDGADSWPLPGNAGSRTSNVYDTRAAIYECWAKKARLASQFMNTGDLSFEQVYKHCCEMRDYYKPFRSGVSELLRA